MARKSKSAIPAAPAPPQPSDSLAVRNSSPAIIIDGTPDLGKLLLEIGQEKHRDEIQTAIAIQVRENLRFKDDAIREMVRLRGVVEHYKKRLAAIGRGEFTIENQRIRFKDPALDVLK